MMLRGYEKGWINRYRKKVPHDVELWLEDASRRLRENAIERYLARDQPTVKQVAKELGVSAPTISNWLRAAGVEIRIPKHCADKGLKQRAVERYLASDKLTVRQVAKELGVSASSVTNWLRAAGVQVRPTGLSDELRQRAIERYWAEDKPATKQVAKELGVSAPTIVRWLHAAGVEVRPTKCGLSNTLKQHVIERYLSEDKPSAGQVAKDLGVSRTSVRNWLRAAGVATRPMGRPPKQRAALRQEPRAPEHKGIPE